MNKLIFCTFILLMFLLPAISFADMVVPKKGRPLPCGTCAEKGCMDCNTLITKSTEGECRICSKCNIKQEYEERAAKAACKRYKEAEKEAKDAAKAAVTAAEKAAVTAAEKAAEEIRQADNSQPQANAEQPKANAEQPQAIAEQPKATAEQPKAEEEHSMREPKVLCSAVPYIPPSIPIACLLMFLISLGLLIHLRRMEK